MLSLLPVVMRFAVLRPNGESPLDKPRQAGGHSDHQTYNCYPGGMKFLVQGIADEPAQYCCHRQSDAQFDHLLRLDPAFFPVALLVCHQDNLTADQSNWQLARHGGPSARAKTLPLIKLILLKIGAPKASEDLILDHVIG